MSKAPNLEEFTKEEIIQTLNEIRHPFEVAVYNSTNYFNFGAIVRTAHSFLCKKLYAVGFDSYYEKAAGPTRKYEKDNIEYLSLESFLNTSRNRALVVFERRPGELNTIDLRTFQWPLNPIMLFGSEKFGVPQEILDIATNIVSIPMYAINNDLNVSLCTGIAMYDWVTKYYK